MLVEYCALLIQSDKFSINYSGLVISGYGENEIFPSLYEYKIDGIILNELKIDVRPPIRINSYNDETYSTAAMRPFAQKEMVLSFVNGIEPSLHKHLLNILIDSIDGYNELIMEELSLGDNKDYLNKLGLKFINLIQSEFGKIQDELYISPILDVLNILPKEELADMAKALVNLTSFKRRISMDAESVGGPIDVCIITKGDGLVWINRKHYFNSELNLNFLKNYNKGIQ